MVHTQLEKCLLKTLKYCKSNKPLIDQINRSLIKIFRELNYNLKYNPNIKVKNKKKLSSLKPTINKVLSKHHKKHINQKGGLLLPFLLPLINNLL